MKNYGHFRKIISFLLASLATQSIQPAPVDQLATALHAIGKTEPSKKAPPKPAQQQKPQKTLPKAKQPLTPLPKIASITKAATELLGPWMLQYHPKKIITYTHNFNNSGIPVYQIKVQYQEKQDCWIHAFRNGLYIMDLALSPRADFDGIYKNMASRDLYKKFTQDGCPRPGYVTREFIQAQLDCIPHCIPGQSLAYLGRVLTLEYEPSFNEKKLQSIKEKIISVESKEPDQKTVFDITLLSDEFNMHPANIGRLIELMHGLRNNQNYCFAINLTIGAVDHEVMLVVHKYNNAIECFFADSNNISFRGDNYTWKEGQYTHKQGMSKEEYKKEWQTFSAAINQIISFIQQPEQFDAAMVRILYAINMKDYLAQKKYNIDQFGNDNWQRLQSFAVEYLTKFYDALARHNLFNNPLYKNTYKKIYCDAIKKEQNEQKKSKLYETLLKKVSC